MNIALEAKRAFTNGTGLGIYNRVLIESLCSAFPEQSFFACTPKTTPLFTTAPYANLRIVKPTRWIDQLGSSYWRSVSMAKDLQNRSIDVFHGLNGELPLSIKRLSLKKIVTIHDLIFEIYPQQYNPVDVYMYRKKYQQSCATADVVVAISEQTKADLIQYYKVPSSKIQVCYQAYQSYFDTIQTATQLQEVAKKYNLPPQFFLFVGSITERKNLLTICKAYAALASSNCPPLLVVGTGGGYRKRVQQYIREQKIEHKIIFLSYPAAHTQAMPYVSPSDLPALYQLAKGLVYPSLYEGFGLPIIEAMASGTPVITSTVSVMPETAQGAALLVPPTDVNALKEALETICHHPQTVQTVIAKGRQVAKRYEPIRCVQRVMDLYLN